MSEEFGRAFVVKTAHKGTNQPVEGVFDELRNGRARIGWSGQDSCDLRKIRDKQGRNLDGHQIAAMRCLGFLTRVHEDDLLLYPHQPKRGQLSVVRVTGEYDYDAGLENGDFRSVRPCKLVSGKAIDLYDKIVLASLRDRLKRPPRFSIVSDTEPLKVLLGSLSEAGQVRDGTDRVRINRIHAELRKGLPDAIRREFSGADLSRRLCSQLFERMGYNHEVREGRGEFGSDVVVEVGNPLLPDEGFRVGVQVFAYEGDVHEGSLERKLKQLRKGWESNKLDYGVLLTTGNPTDEAQAMLDSHNRENPKHHVKLIDGNMLADLFLQHFPPTEGAAAR